MMNKYSQMQIQDRLGLISRTMMLKSSENSLDMLVVYNSFEASNSSIWLRKLQKPLDFFNPILLYTNPSILYFNLILLIFTVLLIWNIAKNIIHLITY